MKVLVIGQGGREHSLVRALLGSSSVSEVHCLPGSDGIRRNALCHDLSWQNFDNVVQLCLRAEIDVVVIGPEDPLVQGLADYLREYGILVVGPSKDAARLEGSKIFAKEFMQAAGVSTARSVVVQSVADVQSHQNLYKAPYVLKADGLAAGKGVYVCKTHEELLQAAHDLFEKKVLGEAGSRALLEEFTPGWELSYLILTNGQDFQALPLAQDHKRLRDGDQGPNTGGMGTVAPMEISDELRLQIEDQIIGPTLKEMQKRQFVYRGVLFLGLMISPEGPSLLEYNCRFGDPETQVILPLVGDDWALKLRELAQGKISPLKILNRHAVCVVLASPGYPDSPQKGVAIDGDIFAETPSSYFVHAGTKLNAATGKWETAGGRVLGAVGIGSTKAEALRHAYHQSELVQWSGLQKRKDIGLTNSNAT